MKEGRTLLPSQVKKALDDLKKKDALSDYPFRAATIRIAGTLESVEGQTVLVARGSKAKYVLKSSKALPAAGREVEVAGALTEPAEKDGKKPLPMIEVASCEERKK